MLKTWVLGQFEKKRCPIRPEEHGTDRPLQNRLVSIGGGAFVEAARIWAGSSLSTPGAN
jgi:hypothetical protein